MKYRNNLLRAFSVASLAASLICAPVTVIAEDLPVSIDSRIRTLVYSANEVFKMYTEYGYQSNIEFGKDEQIATISLGSPSAFKITPSSNRLFIKALQKGRHTNMTVVTTKRTYQFELFSSEEADGNVIYVMRFYYPEEHFEDEGTEAMPADGAAAAPDAPAPVAATQAPVVTPASSPAPAPTATAAPEPETKAEAQAPENYNYSLTGPEAISPVRIYDNGISTFFKFSGSAPVLYGVNPDGSEYPLSARVEGEYVVVDTVLQRFSVRQGSEVVCVFNETFQPGSAIPDSGRLAPGMAAR